MSRKILEVSGLTKSFGGITALSDVTFSLEASEMLALIGPNGAGKSTCFNLLMGQLRSDAGVVKFCGQNISALRPRQIWRLGIGRTFQITATYASMTVIENVQMAVMSYHRRYLSMWPLAKDLYRDEARELLHLVEMDNQAQRPAAILAYGDVKRLELAIALANKPTLLLLDEPTAGMGPSERVALMNLISAIIEERDIGALFTEHDMNVIFAHAHRILVLNRGKLIADGTVAEVRGDRQVREVYLGGGAGDYDAAINPC